MAAEPPQPSPEDFERATVYARRYLAKHDRGPLKGEVETWRSDRAVRWVTADAARSEQEEKAK